MSVEDPWAQADAVLADLEQALSAVGVLLPSVGVDLASTVGGTPLINLGRVNLVTAQALTKALRKSAGARGRLPASP
jgi:hypothetical protein